MKTRLAIISFVLFLSLFTFISTPVSANGTGATMSWSDEVNNGARFTWQVDSITHAGGTASIGGVEIVQYDYIDIYVDETPSTSFDDMFTMQVPSWLDIQVMGTSVNDELNDLEIDFFSIFIAPINIDFQNGSLLTIEQFLNVYRPYFTNLTFFSSWDGKLQVDWNNGTYRMVYHLNVMNGIVQMGQFESPEGILVLVKTDSIETSIPEETSEPEDEMEPPTTLGWYSGLKTGTIFGWQVTQFEQTSDEAYAIGDHEIEFNDTLQIGYTKNPPTDAMDFFDPQGPPDWLKMYFNGDELDISTIGSEGEFLMLLILPLDYNFENGSTLHLKDFLNLLPLVMGGSSGAEDFIDYSVVDAGDYWNVTWTEEYVDENTTHTSTWHFQTNKDTGIMHLLSVNATEGKMVWKYYEDAANVDEEGTEKEIEEEHSIDVPLVLTTPSYGFMTFFVAIGFLIIFSRRK